MGQMPEVGESQPRGGAFLSTAREGWLPDGFLLGWELSSVPMGGREEDERAVVMAIGNPLLCH